MKLFFFLTRRSSWPGGLNQPQDAADALSGTFTPEQVTDLGRDVRGLLSYAVGCMMGCYSLDEPGLIHAVQPFDAARHTTFPADADGILSVTLDAYFDDDVTVRFAEFLRVTFAPEARSKNLEFVVTALGGQKAGESAEARIQRYFASEFVSDHIQTYKKRPIYWLFNSGKRRAFGALVYLHYYDEGTGAKLCSVRRADPRQGEQRTPPSRRMCAALFTGVAREWWGPEFSCPPPATGLC